MNDADGSHGAPSPPVEAGLLGLAVPALFLHATYQPTLTFPFGSADVSLTLADLAIGLVVAAALRFGLATRAESTALLRARRPLLAVTGVFAALTIASLLVPALLGEESPFATRFVTVGKFWWYGLLLPAGLVLARAPLALPWLTRAVVLWSCTATAWGLLQFAGLVDEFEGKRPGQREPSFVGIHDFAALSGAAFVIGVLGLLLGDGRPAGRRWVWPALASGGLGIVLSGAMTGVAGLWFATAALLVLAARTRPVARRAAATAVLLAIVVAIGTSLMRADTLTRFAEFIGLRDRTEQTGVESYAHRTLLAYIGVQIFLDHPLTGVGWNGSLDEWAYSPHLDDARRRFPHEPEQAFPSPEHPWGIQTLYLQVPADMGIAGLVALLALAGVGLGTAWRCARAGSMAALVGLGWTLIAVGIWGGVGLVAGIPVLALTWLGLGLGGADD